MSYSLLNGDQVATENWNGRSRPATGSKSAERTPYELLAWAMLEMAIEDAVILCRYGLIDGQGELLTWPRVKRTDKEGHHHYDPMTIATMNDPLDHARLREFWLDETQGQLWCDLCGCRLPARDIWKSILKNHAK
jgi:hypothetical protein